MPRDYSRDEVLDIIERQAERHQIPRDDFLRFASIETGGSFNERAYNSGSGAAGLFQFVPSTARQYGIGEREFDPEANTDAAARLYQDNRRALERDHARDGQPYLSGQPAPNGLDMYLAHQQGAGGYDSIQDALQTGHFSRASTRDNLIGNMSARDVQSLTGHRHGELSGMSDRELATTFTQYWEAKYAHVRIAEKHIEPLAAPTARQAAEPMADGRLAKGERGAEVQALQHSLNQLGFHDAHGKALETRTGIYGERTTEAVRSFQQANGLEPTGTADARTLGAVQAQLKLPQAERAHAPAVAAAPAQAGTGHWPAPGNTHINAADKPGEGRGEFGTSRAGGTRSHGGVDIQGKAGDPIEAWGAGTVTVKRNNGAAGNTVSIDHGHGVVTRYFHLQDIGVKDGQHVEAGQQIGTMGRTGNTPRQGDTHLHFEMHVNGRKVDPMHSLQVPGREHEHGAAAPARSASTASATATPGSDHPLYKQALERLGELGPNGGFASREQFERAAATTAFEAQVSGFSRIDRVVASTNGQGVFAVQDNPANSMDVRRVYVDRQQAVSQETPTVLRELAQETQQAKHQAQPAQEPAQPARSGHSLG